MSNIETSDAACAAVATVQDLQAELTPLLKQRLSFDFEEGRALYLGQSGELNQVGLVPVSSYGVRSKTTQWAWANTGLQVPEAYGEAVFRSLATETSFDEFRTAEPMQLSDAEVRALLSLVVDRVGGHGLLSEQYGETIWSFVITEIRPKLVSDASEDTIRRALYGLFSQDAVEEFNDLRSRHPDVRLDFAGADLRGAPNPWKGDLHVQAALDHDFVSGHQRRVLDGINLDHCRLAEVNLREVSLRNASLEGSVLVDADLTRADLTNGNLEKAFLNGANFSGASLEGARLAGAELGRTLLIDVDLSSASGLDDVNHSTTSEISFSTLVRSSFKLSQQFMRSAGVSVGLLDDLRRGQRFATTYATCFLSYSSKDAEFAQQLYYALIEAGARVYWDQMELTPGHSLDEQLTRAIREHDRTIAVLSEVSLQSEWLEREVKTALYYKAQGFTPIRLCGIDPIQSFVTAKEIKPNIVDLYPMLDFSGWRDTAEFDRCRDLLLKSIRR